MHIITIEFFIYCPVLFIISLVPVLIPFNCSISSRPLMHLSTPATGQRL